MTKKVFTGERQKLHQLAKDVEEWLREQGFEVQSGTGDGKFLIQARKQSTWRSLVGNNQTIDVKIEGTPERYSIDLDAGAWVKNLADSGGAGIVAALATMYTLGIVAAWSASERSKIETGLWAQKDASCSACFRIGAAQGTGEKFVRAEAITMRPSGYYQGTKVLTDTFRCKWCGHTWEGSEKRRTVDSLCPKCFEEKTRVSTGKKVITCKKADQRSQQGQPLGEQVYTNTFKCNACSHVWDDGQHSQLVAVCPGCVKSDTITPTGEYVFSCNKTDQWSERGLPLCAQTFTSTFRCRDCSHEWNDGQHNRLVEVCPYCEKPAGVVFLGEQVLRNFTRHIWMDVIAIKPNHHDSFEKTQIAIDFEAYIENWRCKWCSKQWNTGEKTRRLK